MVYGVDIRVRPRGRGDPPWIASLLEERWGGTTVTRRAEEVEADALPAFLGLQGPNRVGLATYRVEGEDCEIVTMDCVVRGRGLGRALLRWIAREAFAAGCRRLFLTITGENEEAERFFRNRGFRVTAVRFRAGPRPRGSKGKEPPPLRKEVEMEMPLGDGTLRALGWYAPPGERAKRGDRSLRHRKNRRKDP